jgi:hypothetical protein
MLVRFDQLRVTFRQMVGIVVAIRTEKQEFFWILFVLANDGQLIGGSG